MLILNSNPTLYPPLTGVNEPPVDPILDDSDILTSKGSAIW